MKSRISALRSGLTKVCGSAPSLLSSDDTMPDLRRASGGVKQRLRVSGRERTVIPPKGGRHAVHRVEWPHRSGHQQDHRGRRHECALPRCRRGRAGTVPPLLRSRHHRLDHVSQDSRRAFAALPLHPDGPAELFSKTGPIVYREGVHAVQARTAVALLDALGIERAHWVGNSQGGQSAMVAAITYPERVGKFVMGGSHIGTGGDRYLMANRPSEGSRATRQALDDPSRENIRALPARAHRRREPGDRRAGGLHPPGAHLVARVHRGAPAIGEPAARLHARPRRHPGARPA